MSTNTDVEVLALWQQQAREEQIVPLDDVRTKAERLDAKSRRMRVWMSLLFIMLLIKGAMEVWFQVGILERAGDMLMMAALIYAAYRYRTRHLAAAPVGLFTFITVATFVVSRAAGVKLAAQTLLTKIALAFVFALLEGVLIVVLTAIFGADPARPRALAVLVAPHAIATALFAPLVFSLAERVHQATITVPRPGEGASR